MIYIYTVTDVVCRMRRVIPVHPAHATRGIMMTARNAWAVRMGRNARPVQILRVLMDIGKMEPNATFVPIIQPVPWAARKSVAMPDIG